MPLTSQPAGTPEGGGRIPVNTADPPPEILQVLSKQQIPEGAVEGWLAVPKLSIEEHKVPHKELQEHQVDAYALLQPLLGNPILDQTLRTMDVLNGCGHQCNTCLADAAHPSKMMSLSSLTRLFSDERFLKMLQPDSLRFGSSGDIMDHPDAVAIIRMVLEKTQPCEAVQQRKGEQEHHVVKIYTNYRRRSEPALDELFALVKQYPDRLSVTVSTPLNASDAVNKQFDEYVRTRPQIFGTGYQPDGQGLLNYQFEAPDMLKNVGIADVRHFYPLMMSGRVLSDELLEGRVPKTSKAARIRDVDMKQRGLSKTYLNADALWLMAYATPYESHTCRAFTPLTPENISLLSQIPYHYHFPRPPHWPGGRGAEKYPLVADAIEEETAKTGKQLKNVTVISRPPPSKEQ